MRGRIDTRAQSDPAVAAGMRNIHRDTNGSVLSATTADGQRVNSGGKTLMGSPIRASRLDAGPQTPRLDSMPQGRDPREAARSSALSGAFGTRAQAKQKNLDGRQSLFRDMQAAGAGGVSPEIKSRAAALGVDEKGFGNATAKLQGAPASIAAPGAPAVGNPNQIPSSIARQPGMPAAPLAGNAKAQQDMATIGLDQAAKNFMADNKASLDSASGKPPARIARPAEGNVIPQSIAKPAPKDKKWTTVYNPMEARPKQVTSSLSTNQPAAPATSTPVVKENKPAWGQGITAPMPAPAPMGLKSSFLSDATDVAKATAAASVKVKNAAISTAGGMAKAQDVASVVADGLNRGAIKAAAGTVKGVATAGEKLIPGKTGDAIRSMNIPKQAGNAINVAGNAGADVVKKSLVGLSRFRNMAMQGVKKVF